MVTTVKTLLIMLNNLPQMHLNYFKKQVIQKTVKIAGALIGNKVADKIPKTSGILPQNTSETENTKNDGKILKKDKISPEKRQQIIDELKLKQ